MNIVLIEDYRAPYFSSEMQSKFPNPCIINVTRKSDNSILKLLESSPTLRDKWLVIVRGGTNQNLIKLIAKSTNSINLFMATELNFKTIYSVVSKYSETKILNMVNPSDETCLSIVKSRLSISDEIANQLVRISRNYLPFLEEYITTLECLNTVITKESIKEFIQPRNNLTVYSLVYKLTGISEISNKQLMVFLHDYRYATPYLRKRLLVLLDAIILMYKNIEIGELGLDNIEEFISKNKLKVTPYFTKRVIDEMHKSLKFSALILIRYQVEKCTNIIMLINLFS